MSETSSAPKGKIFRIAAVIVVIIAALGICIMSNPGCVSCITGQAAQTPQSFSDVLNLLCADGIVISAAALLLGVLAVMFLIKERHRTVPVMEFYAPNGLNPAEVGYIIDGHISSTDMASLIYYWASHGHLSIEMTGENTFTLRHQSDLDEGHSEYERELFTEMWYLGGAAKNHPLSGISDEDFYRLPGRSRMVTSAQLTNKFNYAMRRAYRALRAGFDAKERRLTRKGFNRAAAIIPTIAATMAMLIPLMQYVGATDLATFLSVAVGSTAIVLIVGIRLFESLVFTRIGLILVSVLSTTLTHLSIRGRGVLDGVSITFYPLLAVIGIFLASGLFEKGYVNRKTDRKRFRTFTSLGIVLGLVSSAAYTLLFINSNLNIFAIAAFSLAVLLCVALSPYLRCLTKYGEELVTRCESYRHFLITAEKDRLEMLLADDPDYYYHTLPYAHVLGVSGIWKQKTEDLNIDLPSWFVSDYNSINRVTSAMMQTLDSMSRRFKKGKGKN